MNWDEHNRRIRRYVATYNLIMKRALMEQLDEVIEEITPRFQVERIQDIVSDKNISEAYIKLYKDVGVTFSRDLPLKQGDNLVEGMVIELADIGTRIRDVTNFSKELLEKAAREALRQGMSDGLGTIEIAELMREYMKTDFTQFTKARALRIAMTEVGMASNAGAYVGVKMTGIPIRKKWMTAPRGVAKTERHTLIPGLTEQRPERDQDFEVDGALMAYPGDPRGGPENVINCRCVLSWEVI